MPEILLATKLSPPFLPPGLLQRQSLLELFESGLALEKRLILVCAPPGYGKTTLVCEGLKNTSNIAWVSLEESENDPRQFLSYLVAGLQKAFPGWGEPVQGLLKSPQPPPLQAILSLILNDLASVPTPGVLVLDDYQTIHTPTIHEGLTFLLDHLPPGKHIVITTRSDPALPLHRYRTRGQMVEIRAEDLRFSRQEVSSYMEKIGRVLLNSTELATLERRTEGWVAGLQMVAISLRGKSDQEQFIRALAGTNRFILDYLVEEVLSTQPDEVQKFLMETAILDRLCASLCDALTKIGTDASQELLQYLERANLFIIPLDDERSWYRYHHLFRDLLVMRLKQSFPERLSALHRSAADWFEKNGWISEAVHHNIQAGDFDRAADLVERHSLALFAQGNLDQMVGWIRKLPADLSAHRPWLSIYQAWALAFMGKNIEAEEHIEIAIRSLDQSVPSLAERKKLWTEIHGIRGLLAITSASPIKALALADLLEEEVPQESLFARSVILWSLGYAWRIQGELARAVAAFREVLAIGRQIDNLWTMSTGFADLGMALRLSGRLNEAETVFRDGLDIMRQAGASGLGFIGRLQSFLASILYEQNKLDEAEKLIVESIAHNELWKNPNHVTHSYWTQARIFFAKGDAAVESALKKAEDTAAHPAIVPGLRAGVESLRVRFWLAQGRLAEAGRWLKTSPLPEMNDQQSTEADDVQILSHARVMIAGKDMAAARKILDGIESRARITGQNNTLIEVLVLKALAAPKRTTALDILESALELGVPEGYRRTFLDEGDSLVQLLEGLRGRSTFVELLMGTARQKPKAESLLTGREVDILRGMAEGLSNKEIGQRLFISVGTVKAHSAAIYRKLDVANRTEAIARAKDLALV